MDNCSKTLERLNNLHKTLTYDSSVNVFHSLMFDEAKYLCLTNLTENQILDVINYALDRVEIERAGNEAKRVSG